MSSERRFPVRLFVLLALASTALPRLAAPAFAAEPPSPAVAQKLQEAWKLNQRGRFDDAVSAFKAAQKLSPEPCPDCIFGLIRSFGRLNAYQEVIKNVDALSRVTTDRKLLIAANQELGVAYQMLARQERKNFVGAEAAYRRVLELSDGTDNAARFELGFSLLAQGKDVEGVPVLQEYLKGETTPAKETEARDLIESPLRARKTMIPNFKLVTLDGRFLTWEELRGKILLLDFWGSWCQPCVAAQPALRDLGREMSEEPFVLISVSSDADEQTVRDFLVRHNADWPQVWDEGGRFAERCHVRDYPTYSLANGEGEIVFRRSGWSEQINLDLHAAVYREIRALKKQNKKTKAAGGVD